MDRVVVQTLLDPDEAPDPRVDLVELRLDLHPGADARAVALRAGKPVVACVRRARDGGAFAGSEAERVRLLRRAGGALWMDVEVDAPPDAAPHGPRRLVSHHDLTGVPGDLPALYARCLARGADRVKIAVTPPSAAEALPLLDLPDPGLGLGDYGFFTRILAPWTYCAREPVAAGQPDPATLLDVYRVRRLGPAPALYGVVGDPVAHSRSPHLHNAALDRDGIDAAYVPFRVRDLASFWPRFVARGGKGLSVTAPLKEEAARLAAAPSGDVRACGAANTLLADGRAFNTDVLAFLELVPPGRGDALVLGAGGAARAAVLALGRLGYRVRVWNRTPERARALGAGVADRPGPAPVVVNTTPLEPPAAPFVVDLRYGPRVQAPVAGVDGLTFLRAQARHQYRLFFGREL